MLKKIIFTVLTVAWMGVIFCFSSMDSVQSTEVSMSVGECVAEAFVPNYDDMEEEQQYQIASKIDHPIRKTAHATEYAILGFLLTFAVSSYSDNGKMRLIAFPAGVFYSVTDELHQKLVSGRSCQFTDVCIDSGGVLFGVICACVILHIIDKNKNKKMA